MPRLTRKNIKVFAGSATNNGVFGSLQANNPTTTSDVEQLQSLSAWEQGWNSATETSEELPPLEEIQGVEYVTTYQQAYLMQEGVPEWSSSVTYYVGSVVKEVTSTGFRIYNSLTDNNTGNLLSDTSNWKLVMDSDDVYAFDNTVVHKTGDETIGGVKTFNNPIHFKSSVFVDDAYGDEGGEIEFAKAPNSSLTANIHLDSWKNSMRIFGWDSNNVNILVFDADIEENAVFVPSSDKINAAISTVGINKSSNGYVKLGNGIIIQWGITPSAINADSSVTITLPTAFTSSNYSVSVCQNGTMQTGGGGIDGVDTKTTTSFTLNHGADGNYNYMWIAIGY